MDICFRSDKYGLGVFAADNGKELRLDGSVGSPLFCTVKCEKHDEITKISCTIKADSDYRTERLFLRLGIDCYMKSYPEWNDKLFPTLVRCEKRGVWGCFVSPSGAKLAIASPDKFISWKNEYERGIDVGHRIYTVDLDILNALPQPVGHPEPCGLMKKGEYVFSVYLKFIENDDELYSFVKEYSDIDVYRFEKYTLEQWEKPVPLFNQKFDIKNNNGRCDVICDNAKAARTRLFYRKEWSCYLKCAAEHADRCQQKSGSHTESWYGFFTKAAYAKYLGNEEYSKKVCREFDGFFNFNTRKNGKMKLRTDTMRLQNVSCMISLLVSFYDLSGDKKYLDSANILASQLTKMQKSDGAFYSHGTHYTCVIYPAKSMLDLALAEKGAGLDKRYEVHYDSCKRAVLNLAELLDNIQTEGQMTFEDGMISCEALQIAYFALNTDDENLRDKLTKTAEYILKKHRCLEQTFAPDARIRGCTLRFWEARYDINFNSNMLNSPHGWTSWKTYATYYLYLLTGKSEYLKDTMDTMGACVQVIDDEGILRWAYIPDPCIRGKKMIKSDNKRGYDFEEVVVGEEYLPTISDWYKTNPKKFVFQYIRCFSLPPNKHSFDYGGSCDNDVHEHFKCLSETLLSKAFIHLESGENLLYGCIETENGFESRGDKVKTLVIYSDAKRNIIFNGKPIDVKIGVNMIEI